MKTESELKISIFLVIAFCLFIASSFILAVDPTGDLTAEYSSCEILPGQSNCNINFSWIVNNPYYETNTVTKPVNITVASGGNSATDIPLNVKYGSETFYLYHFGGMLLDQRTVTSYCTPGSFWTGSYCATAPGMYGTLTPSPSSCTITAGQSSCTVGLNWTLNNPQGIPTSITAEGMANIDVTNVLSTPQSGSTTGSVPYGSRTFYLYNSGIILGKQKVTSSCASGSSWNGSICAIAGPVAPSMSLDNTTCMSIKVTYVDNATDEQGFSIVRSTGSGWSVVRVDGTPLAGTGGTRNWTDTSLVANTSYSYRVYAYNNGGNSYNGSDLDSRMAVSCTPPSSTATLSASSLVIYSGSNTTLNWSCASASSVGTNFNTGGQPTGNLSVSPSATTTYTVTCSDASTSQVTVTVKKKPSVKEF